MKHQHNLDCEDVLRYLNDYIDDELDGELCARFEAHIEDCKDCKIVLNTLKKTLQLFHSSGHETKLPKDVQKRLYERLDLKNHARKE